MNVTFHVYHSHGSLFETGHVRGHTESGDSSTSRNVGQVFQESTKKDWSRKR